MEKPAVLEEKGKLKSRYEGGEVYVSVCVCVHSVHFRWASAIEGRGWEPPGMRVPFRRVARTKLKEAIDQTRIWPQNHSAKRAIVFRSILSNSSPDRLAANWKFHRRINPRVTTGWLKRRRGRRDRSVEIGLIAAPRPSAALFNNDDRGDGGKGWPGFTITPWWLAAGSAAAGSRGFCAFEGGERDSSRSKRRQSNGHFPKRCKPIERNQQLTFLSIRRGAGIAPRVAVVFGRYMQITDPPRRALLITTRKDNRLSKEIP